MKRRILYRSTLTVFMLIVLSACEGDMEGERTVEWTGLHLNAGNEVHYLLEPLPGSNFPTSGKSIPTDVPIDNSGFASHSFKFAGATAPGLAYYYVDGNGNGRCDEYNTADPRGAQEFAANDALISIEFVDSSLAPEGVCTYFGADLDQQAASPDPTATLVPADTLVVTNPTVTPTPAPSYEELYEEAALAAVKRFYDASNAHDLEAMRRATSEDSFFVDDGYIESMIYDAEIFDGESDYATLNITNLFRISCREFRCELILDVDKFFPSGEGGSIRIPEYVDLENGEWKYDWS
ncbi:MAG: hypothetical protein HOF01_09860 [Chloroflexi bacterium]|nr:hypothetical protein [Chloroflexota bacterium]